MVEVEDKTLTLTKIKRSLVNNVRLFNIEKHIVNEKHYGIHLKYFETNRVTIQTSYILLGTPIVHKLYLHNAFILLLSKDEVKLGCREQGYPLFTLCLFTIVYP